VEVEALGFGGEADDAGDAVVVGDGQRVQAQRNRLRRHRLGIAGAVEQREVGVGVELGVGE
jgi:hypothetical protein